MRRFFFILFVQFSIGCFAQSEFVRNAQCQLPRRDSLFSFQADASASGKYNYFSDSTEQVEQLLNKLLKKADRNRADTLRQSLVLTELATLCVKQIHVIMPTGNERKKRLEKRIRRIFFGSSCSFGLIEVVSFEIPLVKQQGHFHYNKNGPEGGFNLYEGKTKPKKTKEDPEPEEVPLDFYTYEQIQQRIHRELSRRKAYRYFNEKQVAAFGYCIQLDKSTLHTSKIPKLKVLLILGEKRFSYKQRKSFNKKTSFAS
ncbi:hypothetical protein [Fluviicola sp.]|uniref:hypothetical protein n=1 Tax=Fluviicola sp. TaxID=1917219 RepID=UPI0031DB8E84